MRNKVTSTATDPQKTIIACMLPVGMSLLICCAILLQAHRLPLAVGVLAGACGGVLTAVGVVWAIAGKQIRALLKGANRQWVSLVTAACVLLPVTLTFVLFPVFPSPTQSCGIAQCSPGALRTPQTGRSGGAGTASLSTPGNTTTRTPVVSPSPIHVLPTATARNTHPPITGAPTATAQPGTPVVTVSPTSTATAQPTVSWPVTLARPYCDDASDWYLHEGNQETSATCTSTALALAQSNQSSGSTFYYASMDLQHIEGASYSQITFTTAVTLQFASPGDSKTWAVIYVQSPSDPQTCGGYAFEVNGAGTWKFLEFTSCNGVTIITTGAITFTNGTATITIIGQPGTLSVSVNNVQEVPPTTVTAPPASAIMGFMVEGPQSGSSTVYFSNFSLNAPS